MKTGSLSGQIYYVTPTLLRQEHKVPLHSFKKSPRSLTSSSHESLGFDEPPKPFNVLDCHQNTRECVSGSRDRETMV